MDRVDTVDEILFRETNFFTDTIDMSNSTIDTETIDFTEGEDFTKALYNERNCVSATWDDFLKLPKIAGYVNNVKRVPNSQRTRKVIHLERQKDLFSQSRVT